MGDELVIQALGLVGTFQSVSWGSVIRVQGALNQGPMTQLIEVARQRGQAHRHLAALCDYSQAVMVLDPREQVRCALEAARGSVNWPTALIVQADVLEVWRDYAYLQGMEGALRKVFTAHEPARAWAIEQAGLRLAQISCRRRSS